MDSGEPNRRESKRRFQPRLPTPPLRTTVPPIINTEAEDEEENKNVPRRLAKRFGIGQARSKRETEASSSEVAFQSNFSSLAIKSFGGPKEDDKRGSDVISSSSAVIPPAILSPIAPEDEEDEVHNLVTGTEDGYVEPWDYKNSCYPTVLPWRKPNSGDPEFLDQEEFGDLAEHREYDENAINSAEELGLTSVQHCEKQMFFFKVPDCLPVMKQSTGTNTKTSVPDCSFERSNPFEGLPEGFMGKMLVYKSGNVKLKLGDVLFEVFPGPNATIPNDVAAINTKERNCCRIGSLAKFVTVTPDIKSLLNPASDMETHK